MKELPSLYTNNFDKKIDNSQEYITISNDEVVTNINKYEIQEKINNIFKSKKYIYKINVEIKLKDKTITETLIGKTNKSLITINNELIDINNIMDIKIKSQ